MQISSDSIKSLPVKVLSVYLHAKFDDGVLNFVTLSLAALDTLPNSMQKVSLANLTGLSKCEVIVICFLFVAILYTIKRKKFRNVDITSLGFPVLLTPPTGVCIVCSGTLSEHNKTCDVSMYGLLGKVAGRKFSLRCDRCKLNYNYNRYGDRTRGWNLYESQ